VAYPLGVAAGVDVAAVVGRPAPGSPRVVEAARVTFDFGFGIVAVVPWVTLDCGCVVYVNDQGRAASVSSGPLSLFWHEHAWDGLLNCSYCSSPYGDFNTGCPDCPDLLFCDACCVGAHREEMHP